VIHSPLLQPHLLPQKNDVSSKIKTTAVDVSPFMHIQVFAMQS